MPDDDEWLVDEIVGHRFVGKSIKFNVHWMAGDHTWEPFTSVKDLKALDHYFALMGVTRWQSLARKPTIDAQVNPLRVLVREGTGLRNRRSGLRELGCRTGLANRPVPHAIFGKLQ